MSDETGKLFAVAEGQQGYYQDGVSLNALR